MMFCGDGVTDNSAAFEAALNAKYHPNPWFSPQWWSVVPPIELGIGRYRITRPIRIKTTALLRGPSTGLPGLAAATIFADFDDADGAVIIESYDTATELGEGEGAGTRIEGIRIEGRGKQHGAITGVIMRRMATLQNVQIEWFGGHGIEIAADVHAGGNANIWQLHTIHSRNNGGHGVYVHGGDTNAGVGIGVNVTHNDGCGIFDDSFLGNLWIAPHSDSNGDAHYKVTNPNNTSIFLGAYGEGGWPAADVRPPAMMIGGQCERTPGTYSIEAENDGFRMAPGMIRRMTPAEGNSRPMTAKFGTQWPDVFWSASVEGDAARGIDFRWSELFGCYAMAWGNSIAHAPLMVTSSLCTMNFGRAVVEGGMPWLPRGLFVGAGNAARWLTFAPEPPAGDGFADGFADGDTVFNTGAGPLLWRRESGVWVEKWADGERPAAA